VGLKWWNPNLYTGSLRKLKSTLSDPIQYHLPIDEIELLLNDYLGKTLTLKFEGNIQCVHCQRKIKKSYNQGYCFPCAQTLARCDFCIVKPEKCHFHLGTCREPEWGKTHCFIPHIVYLANTSGLKVGITRETQIPTRWIDQGAVQALPICRVKNRYHSGLVEVAMKSMVADKTDWRKMLKGQGENIALFEKRDELFKNIEWPDALRDESSVEILQNQSVVAIQYPVLSYPEKVTAFNLEKTPEISGTLLGIKGQYLIFDKGVLNIRNLTGYVVSVYMG
jgi:hypothetical protein